MMKRKAKILYLLYILVICSVIFLPGCRADHPKLSLKPPADEEDTVTAPTPHYEPREETSLSKDKPYLRFTIAPVMSSPQSRENYRALLSYLPEKAGHPVELVMRSSHGEVVQLLKQNMVDVALICPSSYVEVKETGEFEMLAVPQIQGQIFYQTYIITSAENEIENLEDLRGETFVFTDPQSFSGSLYTFHLLEQEGEDVDTFFADYFYSYNSDNSVLAVAEGWISGGAVNSLVYDYLVKKKPELGESLQVIETSSRVGYLPVAVSTRLPEEVRENLQDVLLSMHRDEQGRKALEEIRVDRFFAPEEFDYEGFNKLIDIWEAR